MKNIENKMNNKEFGNLGENIACEYLINNGYSILARNHKERADEIDIITSHPDGTLAFVEVKTISTSREKPGSFMPEDNLTSFKLAKISRACQAFVVKHQELIDENRGWQIDLVAITINRGVLVSLNHYQNV